MATTEAPTATRTRIVYDRESCSRCGGTGQMPFSVWAGRCFKCSGNGSGLTPTARKVKGIVDDVIRTRCAVPASSVQPGDRVMYGTPAKPCRVVDVLDDERTAMHRVVDGERVPALTLVFNKKSGGTLGYCLDADATVQRPPVAEDIDAAIAALGKRRAGFTIERY